MRELALLLALPLLGWSASAQEPLWNLQTNGSSQELTKGNVQTENGSVLLNEQSSLGIPNSAFKDPENFTLTLALKFQEFPQGTTVNLLYKQTAKGEGFAVVANNSSFRFSSADSINGNVLLVSRNFSPGDFAKLLTQEHVFQYVGIMKNGLWRHYLDGVLAPRALTKPLANGEPLWIGNSTRTWNKAAYRLAISDLKVYGPEYTHPLAAQASGPSPRGLLVSKEWQLGAPEPSVPKPCVFIYGDSISNGYKRMVYEQWQERVDFYDWFTFVSEKTNKGPIVSALKTAPFELVFFNNGLHSLHWTPDQVSDEEVRQRTQDLVDAIREGAPKATLVWLNTTPYTAAPGPDKKVTALGDKNEVVLRLNRLAQQVMEKNGIEILDVYAELLPHLDAAAGDHLHWGVAGSKLIADRVSARLEAFLKQK